VFTFITLAFLASATTMLAPPGRSADGLVSAGEVLRVSVPEAFGGKTVIGQITVDRARTTGFVTAFPCSNGLSDSTGGGGRSDLNFDGRVTPFASNRLIVEADDAGDVCFFTSAPVDMIVDVNAVSFDRGITSIPNRRTDTRSASIDRRVIPAGGTLRVAVPEASMGKTVIGQLTVDRATTAGYVTAHACDAGIEQNDGGEIVKSDLNFDGDVSAVASNRLIVRADDDGDVCFRTSAPVALIVDINGISDTGIEAFPNRRVDTRRAAPDERLIAPDEPLRLNVPEAVGGGIVLGQLTVDGADTAGFLTAYACADGLPRNDAGAVSRSDLNFDGNVAPVASNRLIVEADDAGDVCVFASEPTAIVVDVSAVASDQAIAAFPNRRVDTRAFVAPVEPVLPPGPGAIPIWPTYQAAPALEGVAALTGARVNGTVTSRPILAVKIDNYRLARPQIGLDQADAIIEMNAEGVTRFIALFHSQLPAALGPVRSARTGDLDLLAAMNRPVFGYSGANAGVNSWIRSAADSAVLVPFGALERPCYRREPSRPGPHNLLVDPACAIDTSSIAGPAGPLWTIDPAWTPPAGAVTAPDSTFTVPMDGVAVEWTWDPRAGAYLRSQDGVPHLAESGAPIAARNVVHISTDYVPSAVDSRSPVPISVGTGIAVVHRNGIAIRANWTRPTVYDRFSFYDPVTGLPVLLDRGMTFVELSRGSASVS
jgi:hypothetical protein